MTTKMSESKWRKLLTKLVSEESQAKREKYAAKLVKLIEASLDSSKDHVVAEEKIELKEEQARPSKSKKQKVEKPAKDEDEDMDQDVHSRNGSPEPNVENSQNGSPEPEGSAKKRFQRVDENKALQKALIADNSYDALFGQNGYGAKANEKLKQVKGKDFRHEKTKKKRGSYRGGVIDTDVVNSVVFDD